MVNKSSASMILMVILCTLSTVNEINAQCSGSTQFSTAQIPCSGLINEVTSVPRSSYILVHVINGVNYSFTSTYNGITLRNDSNNAQVGHTTGSSISYSASFSGLIRVYHCANPNQTATLTFIANNTGSNIQDYQSVCGSNNWVGHLYKRLDNSAATPPSNSDAFTSYIGYLNRTEVFSEGFGGNTNCLPTLSNGANVINTYSEFFTAKFCNQSVKPAGAYVLSSVTSDDGLRIYVGGILVFDRWINQAPTTYTNILFQHSGNTKLELHYFESTGENVLNLGTMTRVNNLLSSNLNQTICEEITPGQIAGTNVLTTAPINSALGYNVTYQWQLSTNNITFSSIAGATSKDYTPVLYAPGSYYFRRLATIYYTNPSSISIMAVDVSNVSQLLILTKPNGSITSSEPVICAGTAITHFTFNATIGAEPFTLIINGISYLNIFNGVAFIIAAPLVTTGYNLTNITDVNGCVNP